MQHRIRFLHLLLALFPVCAAAQHMLHGRVVDDRTMEPLAFVHVVPVDEREGATTDIDGRFELSVPGREARLRFSYVGYAATEVQVKEGDLAVVRMHRNAIELREVEVLPGENPAHRIIARVYAERRRNDGLRNRSHRYTSYSKTIFTAALDSALINDPARLAQLDSNDQEMLGWLEKQYFLMIESATKRSFIPPAAEKEEVLAMRVSGLKDPSLLALAASTKTFSLYEPQVRLNEKSYLSPIGPSSTAHYLFLLEDTLYQGSDSVFVISYRPRSGKKFHGMKGVLWVNTDGYALQNVIAEPVERSGGASIKLQQQFEKVNGIAWFPVQLNTFLYLDMMQVNSWKVMGIGRTYLKDIEVDAPVARREVRGPEMVMEAMATRRDEAFWEGLRNEPLAEKELRTYVTIDSISAAEGVERKLKWLERLTTGRMAVGPFDLHLDQMLRYNGYENLRLGLGASTNDRVSRHASVGGFAAYGFGDEQWKYGGDITLKPRPGRDLAIRGYYLNDVDESGGVSFPGQRRGFTSESYRWLYVDRMDRVERFGGEVAVRVNSALKLWVGSERAERINTIGYQYAEPVAEGVTLLTDRFLTGVVSLAMRYAYGEQLVRLPGREMVLPSRWPVFYASVFQAMDGLWQGDREFWRVNAMVEKTFRIRLVGDLSVRAMGGVADDRAPYPFLFNLRGTYSTSLPVGTQYTFETMRPNEFLADRYAALHLRHSFGNLLYKGKRFRPVPVIVANAGWSALAHPERHRGYTFNALDQGYYEAGLQIDALLRMGISGFGLGAYYRLGPNALPDAMDNLALKLTVGFVP